jgi:UDP-N-acetylmuramoylalanine--D-glutamate ligase
VISLVETVAPGDVLVIEMSSYQLEQMVAFRPDVGVLLNLAPDHLARHGSMRAYAESKGQLFKNQKETDVAVLPRCLADRFSQGRARRVYYDEQFADLPSGATKLRTHEQANLRAALCAWEAVSPIQSISDVDLSKILPALRLPHRMSPIGWVNDVLVINDSKATNPAATVAAISSLPGRLVLLLGGRFKEGGYNALASAVDADRVRQIVLFGEASAQLEAALSAGQKAMPRLAAASLEDAVHLGLRVAEPGDTLLLSPACSSFDGFRDFADRGERFADVIRRYPGYRSA